RVRYSFTSPRMRTFAPGSALAISPENAESKSLLCLSKTIALNLVSLLFLKRIERTFPEELHADDSTSPSTTTSLFMAASMAALSEASITCDSEGCVAGDGSPPRRARVERINPKQTRNRKAPIDP